MKFQFFNKRELTNEERKNRFYKKLKVNQNSSQSEINEKIYAYAAKGKKLDLVYLDKERLLDPVFMSVIYNVNPDILKYYQPDLSLQNNYMFMKVYIRNMLSHANLKEMNMHDYLVQFLTPCIEGIKNIEVVKYIVDSQTGTSGILALRDILITNCFLGCIDRDNYEAFLKIVDDLPLEHFEREIRYNNGSVLSVIDPTHKLYGELVKKSARMHGFSTLKNVDRFYLMKNPDVIYHAVDKDGVNLLYQYLMFELRKKEGEIPSVVEEKRKLRKALVNDDKIREMLNDEFMVANEMLDALYSQL